MMRSLIIKKAKNLCADKIYMRGVELDDTAVGVHTFTSSCVLILIQVLQRKQELV